MRGPTLSYVTTSTRVRPVGGMGGDVRGGPAQAGQAPVEVDVLAVGEAALVPGTTGRIVGGRVLQRHPPVEAGSTGDPEHPGGVAVALGRLTRAPVAVQARVEELVPGGV